MALKYNYKKDYKDNEAIEKVGEGHAKYQQCMFVVNEIMLILNTNRYNNLDNFIENNYTLEMFLNNNPHIQTALKHVNTFGDPINEKDYEQIKTVLREITLLKQSIDTTGIKKTSVDDKQYNHMKIDGIDHYIDNSKSDKSLENIMKDTQTTQSDFQTTDTKKNSENIFKELENRQQALNLKNLNEIDYDSLSKEEQELFNFILDYQASTPLLIKVDIKKGIIVDENDNIMKISKNDGEISIIKEEDGVQKQEAVTPSNNDNYDVETDNINNINDDDLDENSNDLKIEEEKEEDKKDKKDKSEKLKEKTEKTDDENKIEELENDEEVVDEFEESKGFQKQFKLTLNNNSNE